MKIGFILALSMGLLFHTSAQADIVAKEVTYTDGSAELRGTLFYDETISSLRPGIVVFPEWWGHNDYVKQRAMEIAEQGYVALAADMYGKNKVTTDPEKAKQWSGALYADREVMRKRARAAITELTKQPNVDKNNIAAVGFCMGGTVALELARAGDDLKGVAAFHAGLQFTNPVKEGTVKAKVLVMNGAADPVVPFSERDHFIEEMQNADADLQFIQYGKAMHAFTNPAADNAGIKGVAYNQPAERRSFQVLHLFFNELFNR